MEWKESYVDRLMRREPGEGKVQARMKRQWSARSYLRFAARYFPEDHPLRLELADRDALFFLESDLSESGIAQEKQRNLELMAKIEKAEGETEVRPAFWRQLVQAAALLEDRERAERYEKCFHEALRERAGKQPQGEGG